VDGVGELFACKYSELIAALHILLGLEHIDKLAEPSLEELLLLVITVNIDHDGAPPPRLPKSVEHRGDPLHLREVNSDVAEDWLVLLGCELARVLVLRKLDLWVV